MFLSRLNEINVIQRGCEAISVDIYKIARNCLAYMLDFFAMQMSKVNREKTIDSLWIPDGSSMLVLGGSSDITVKFNRKENNNNNNNKNFINKFSKQN